MLPKKPYRSRIKARTNAPDNFAINGLKAGISTPNERKKSQQSQMLSSDVTVEHVRQQTSEQVQSHKLIPVDDVMERIRRFREDLRSTIQLYSPQKECVQDSHILHQAEPELEIAYCDDHDIGECDLDVSNLEHYNTIHTSRVPDDSDIEYGEDRDISESEEGKSSPGSRKQDQCLRQAGDFPFDEIAINHTNDLTTASTTMESDYTVNPSNIEILPSVKDCLAEAPPLTTVLKASNAAGDDNSYHLTRDFGCGDNDRTTNEIGVQYDLEIALKYTQSISVGSEKVQLKDAAEGDGSIPAILVDRGVGDDYIQPESKRTTMNIGVGGSPITTDTKDSSSGDGIVFRVEDVGTTTDISLHEDQIFVSPTNKATLVHVSCATDHIARYDESTNTKVQSFVDQSVQSSVKINSIFHDQSTETELESTYSTLVKEQATMRDAKLAKDDTTIRSDIYSFYPAQNVQVDYEIENIASGCKSLLCSKKQVQDTDTPICHNNIHTAANQIMSELDNVLDRLRREVVFADEILEQDVKFTPNRVDGNKSHQEIEFKENLYGYSKPYENRVYHNIQLRPDSYAKRNMIETGAQNKAHYGGSEIHSKYAIKDSNYTRANKPLMNTYKPCVTTQRTAAEKGPEDIIRRHIYRHGLDQDHIYRQNI